MIDASQSQGSVPASTDGKIPPITALGTHDEKRTVFACKHAEKAGLPKEALEFQMLYGIRSDLQDALHARGYPVRVYVPFGTEWYPYFMRRLAERPANLWFFITALVRG
jgi:proline dehydrogenase